MNKTVIVHLARGSYVIGILRESFLYSYSDKFPDLKEVRLRLQYPMSLVQIDSRNYILFKYPPFRKTIFTDISADNIITTTEPDDALHSKYMEQVALELQRKLVITDLSGVMLTDPAATDPNKSAITSPESDALEVDEDDEEEQAAEGEEKKADGETPGDDEKSGEEDEDDVPILRPHRPPKKKTIIH